MATRWQELIVTDAEGERWVDDLEALVETAPANLDTAVVRDGKIVEWDQFFLSAPGESPDWDTPRGEVDWSGFETALDRARGCSEAD